MLKETQVRQKSFSALCLLVLTSVIVKSIQKWNPALGLDDMTHQMKKEKKGAGKYVRNYIYIYIKSKAEPVKVRWEKPASTAGSIDPGASAPLVGSPSPPACSSLSLFYLFIYF